MSTGPTIRSALAIHRHPLFTRESGAGSGLVYQRLEILSQKSNPLEDRVYRPHNEHNTATTEYQASR